MSEKTKDNFGAFLQQHGVLDVDEIQTEENVRVAVDGDKGDEKSGSYRLFMNHGNGIPSGYVNNYRTNDYTKWNGKAIEGAKPLSPADIKKRKAAKQRERDILHQKKFQEFQKEWNSLSKTGIGPAHPYAMAKGIRPAFFLRTEVRNDGNNNLVFPIKDKQGQITNLQKIWSNGNKQLEKDGVLVGSFIKIDGTKDTNFVLLAEGVSTAATVNDITNIDTYASLTGNNLSSVAEVIKEMRPEKTVVIAGDNDYHLELRNIKNSGLINANEAAEKVGGKVVFPPFNMVELESGKTDWNDYSQDKGFSKTRDVLRNAFKKIIETSKEADPAKSKDIER